MAYIKVTVENDVSLSDTIQLYEDIRSMLEKSEGVYDVQLILDGELRARTISFGSILGLR